MINTKQWVDLLNEQFSLVSNSESGLDLLLAVRRFVAFLDTDPHARRYVRDLDYRWDVAHKEWRDKCHKMRLQLSNLERIIRKVGERVEEAIGTMKTIPDAVHRTDHIIDKIREADWYHPWANTRDDLDLELLHVRQPGTTQTGYMISSALTKARVLAARAEEIGEEQETTAKLRVQAEALWRQYDSVRRQLKYNWMSAGKHALEQLRTVIRIIDGAIFVDPANYKSPKSTSLAPPWIALMLRHSPPDLREDIEWLLRHTETDEWELERDPEALIRLYLRRVFEELQFLANSRLAHQHLVERYKARCENYDWKHIAEQIESYVQTVEKKSTERGKEPRYGFEDLLTLHFARYMHDNGYSVHYRLRDGVHEPDLIGNLRNDLEPIVVEAKVVGQEFGTTQGENWIYQGLRALFAYLQKYHSDYGVTDGYLAVFRIGDETFPMYYFDPAEWRFGQFTIVPKVINIGRINKKDVPIPIRKSKAWLEQTE